MQELIGIWLLSMLALALAGLAVSIVWDMSTIVRRENRQKQRAAQKFLPKISAYKSPLDIMLCEIADYNLHQRLAGKPELSYGQYVAKFDTAQKEYHL